MYLQWVTVRNKSCESQEKHFESWNNTFLFLLFELVLFVSYFKMNTILNTSKLISFEVKKNNINPAAIVASLIAI